MFAGYIKDNDLEMDWITKYNDSINGTYRRWINDDLQSFRLLLGHQIIIVYILLWDVAE
jgi:hypothetical protein